MRKKAAASPLREVLGRDPLLAVFPSEDLDDHVRLPFAQGAARLEAHPIADLALLVLVVRPDLGAALGVLVHLGMAEKIRDRQDSLRATTAGFSGWRATAGGAAKKSCEPF